MKYDEAGVYELTYRAVDDCGNEAIATRGITVAEEPPDPWVTAIDVSNYTAPNDTHTPTTNLWAWGADDYMVEATGVLADGVPKTMERSVRENDRYFVMYFDGFQVALLMDYDDYFISEVRGINPPNEVTFEHLVIKYIYYE